MCYIIGMYIARPKWPAKNGEKVYESVWLRESYREDGKVKTRNIANLKNCSAEEINAIELALKYKNNLAALGTVEDVQVTQGPSVGAIWVIYQLAQRIGITKALGTDHNGRLALWQVIARVLDQGSRLSAARLAQDHAATEILGFKRDFCEDDLYANLAYLAEKQDKIEKAIFEGRQKEKPQLFLYDVTSSYLEGEKNAFGEYGYNRDKKRGKMQIVIGLLCDQDGEPVSTQVFSGNTSDLETFASQVEKARQVFGCERVTFVGDRGMIKSSQIEDLDAAKFNYITAITKPQINAMLKKGVFQLNLFEKTLCEVEHEGVRYLLRRNPMRAEEIAANRASKLAALQKLADKQNEYLAEHPRADDFVAWKKVAEKHGKLKLNDWVTVKVKDRQVILEVDEENLKEISKLDGCYALKTDLPKETADKDLIHNRYKDLTKVEMAFRTCKTTHLEIRPVHVRTEASTRGHVLVVMLAYMIVRLLQRGWANFDLTIEEGLSRLKNICAVNLNIKGKGDFLSIPQPDQNNERLLSAVDIRLPGVLPASKINVSTRKKTE